MQDNIHQVTGHVTKVIAPDLIGISKFMTAATVLSYFFQMKLGACSSGPTPGTRCLPKIRSCTRRRPNNSSLNPLDTDLEFY